MPRRAAFALTALALSVTPLAAIDDTDNPSQPRGLGGPSGVVNSTPFGTDAVSTSNGAVSISIPIGQRYSSGGAMGHHLGVPFSVAVRDGGILNVLNGKSSLLDVLGGPPFGDNDMMDVMMIAQGYMESEACEN
jgi:hypothetical protein